MKYLVCVDGSENAEKAFQKAKELYQAGDKLYTLLVVSSDTDLDVKNREIAVIQGYTKVSRSGR